MTPERIPLRNRLRDNTSITYIPSRRLSEAVALAHARGSSSDAGAAAESSHRFSKRLATEYPASHHVMVVDLLRCIEGTQGKAADGNGSAVSMWRGAFQRLAEEHRFDNYEAMLCHSDFSTPLRQHTRRWPW